MKEDGISIDIMGRESISLKMQAKKLDTGFKDINKESFNAMIRVEHLLILRFMSMTKKSSVNKFNTRFKTKVKKHKETRQMMQKSLILIVSKNSLLIELEYMGRNLFYFELYLIINDYIRTKDFLTHILKFLSWVFINSVILYYIFAVIYFN